MRLFSLVTLVMAVILLGVVFTLVRRRQLPEKYAALWLVVGFGAVVLAAVPAALNWTARVLRVVDPVNLLLFIGVMFLLLVCMHLSWECGRLEEETRTIAEQLALLRMDVRRLDGQPAAPNAPVAGRPHAS